MINGHAQVYTSTSAQVMLLDTDNKGHDMLQFKGDQHPASYYSHAYCIYGYIKFAFKA